MRLFIDTNTFPASPALYADAEKTKPLPRILPAVELQKGGFAVAFIGDNGPHAGETLYLAASIVGSGVQVLAEWSEDYVNGAWGFDFALTSEALAEEVKKRGSARLLVGIISDDDTERREWQFNTVVYPTASSEEIDAETVESAKNFAELAEQAAKRAQEAQADVSGNAQLAESAKQTATQAANAAIEAADNAEVSERNAEEAKGAAEQAKTDAESAKAAAQKAASDAQATLGNVYTKSQIDGVDTGAEVTLKMNEIIAMLKDYEEVTGEKLPWELWEQVMAEFQRWQENPNEVKEWVTAKNADGTITSTCPYYETPPTKPVVDFSISRCYGNYIGGKSYPAFSSETSVCVYLPNASYIGRILNGVQHSPILIAPKANDAQAALAQSKYNAIVFLDVKECSALLSNAKEFASHAVLRRARSCTNAFLNTGMSAENIAKTLDSLPTWTDGKSHVITFTGSPGASELTQESPSVAAAIAKGWTVEL